MSGLAGAYHSVSAGCVGWANVPLKGAGVKMEAKLPSPAVLMSSDGPGREDVKA